MEGRTEMEAKIQARIADKLLEIMTKGKNKKEFDAKNADLELSKNIPETPPMKMINEIKILGVPESPSEEEKLRNSHDKKSTNINKSMYSLQRTDSTIPVEQETPASEQE